MPDDATIARAWIRVRYVPQAKWQSNEALAIYGTRIMGGPYAVWIDGKTVHAKIDGWRMQWNKPLLIKLDAENITAERPIEILIAVPFRVAQGYAFGSLYAGPSGIIQRKYDIRFALEDTLPRGAIVVALLLGLFSLQFWLARRSETPHLLLTLASVAWFICNLQFLVDFDDDLIASRWFGALVDASVSWVVLLSFLFAFRIADKEFPRLERTMLFYALTVTLITLPIWNWQMSALVLQHYGNLIMIFALSCLFSRVAWRDGRREVKVVAVSLWSITLFGLHDVIFVTSQRNPDSIFWFPYVPFLLFGSFMFSIQRRYVGALNHVEVVNASLNERLQAREQELKAKHQELLEVEKREAMLMEQKRLMCEIHDGIGSALTSSLILAEQKRLPPERLASILQDCHDELRLMIDSLDLFDQDLVTMLASVQQRLGKRIEDAGIRIDWVMDDLPRLPWFDQSHVLHVLRIVQEALTNILKHAQANEIQISASKAVSETDKPILLVRIRDNGIGFIPGSRAHGHGMKIMRQRAQSLHSELIIDSPEGHGTMIELRLPFELEDAAFTSR